ncbi:hypothetical protein BJ878DRAFT_519490 [Calycina marina]|uniref:Uncharacterized protein n=1 Tax=Calycina marina TaxID=1763456 RepID=A0A9P7YYD9_9HELO|nr:hypothetical protein BJ878DRAFT_519490 [Calycina marina]
MPVYLIHGFRWDRALIRIHVAFHDLDDAAPDWIIAPDSALAFLESFYKAFDFLPPNEQPAAISPTRSPSEHELLVSEETTPKHEPPVSGGTTPKFKSLLKKMASKASLANIRKKQQSSSSDTDTRRRGQKQGKEANKSEIYTLGRKSLQEDDATIRPTTAKTGTGAGTTRPFNDWSAVKLLEQYSLDETSSAYQQYAYVGDHIVEVKLGASITEETKKYDALMETSKDLSWFEKLRGKLQADADIGWHVVICEDEERYTPKQEEVSNYGSHTSANGFSRPDPQGSGSRGFFENKMDNRIAQLENEVRRGKSKLSSQPSTVAQIT